MDWSFIWRFVPLFVAALVLSGLAAWVFGRWWIALIGPAAVVLLLLGIVLWIGWLIAMNGDR